MAAHVRFYQFLQELYKPTVAAINGLCLAQGGGIALSCDIRIASEEAQFGWPQVKRGISSTSGPTILFQQVPKNIAMEMLFTGDFIPAEILSGQANRLPRFVLASQVKVRGPLTQSP